MRREYVLGAVLTVGALSLTAAAYQQPPGYPPAGYAPPVSQPRQATQQPGNPVPSPPPFGTRHDFSIYGLGLWARARGDRGHGRRGHRCDRRAQSLRIVAD